MITAGSKNGRSFGAVAVFALLAIAGCSKAKDTATSQPPPVSIEETADWPDDEPAAVGSQETEWISLFDGQNLGHWSSTQFGGEGEVTVEDGRIVLGPGNDLTGVSWKGEIPARMNYEIELEAMRIEGRDFFCGLTFPVGSDPCTLICGGWGGGVTGLSSLDGNDASQNETSQWINYQNGRWYRIRVRVTEDRIQAWLDDNQLLSADIAGRKIGIRPEVELSKPLGVATWRTTGAIRNIRMRPL
jgi:hypothetical protein